MIEINYREAYIRAMKMGQKEYRDLTAAGLNPSPKVLEEILPDFSHHSIQTLSVKEIPVERIVGTRDAGRISAFSASFYPLLEPETEFATKWIRLCEAHLSDTGIRDPIECYEYLGNFYVQEGNKRVSVLKFFGAVQIPGVIKRVLPVTWDSPQEKAYAEFLEFYKATELYDVQFRKPGFLPKLLKALGKQPGEVWTEQERKSFASGFLHLKESVLSMGASSADRGNSVNAEDALLLWLQVYPFENLEKLSDKELKAAVAGLWEDIQSSSVGIPAVHSEPDAEQKSLLDRLIPGSSKHITAAFVHMRDKETSDWTRGHAAGADHLAEVLGEKVSVKSYEHADTQEEAEKLLDEAVKDGAEVVFTTAPPLLRSTLKAAVQYPKVHFLNCSTGTQLSSVRSYYCRTFEGKFITGLIAGAMADDNLIGFIAGYPILGVPAAINAFALGAQMTNPRARILLEWSCLPGDPVQKLLDQGVRVISNRDIPLGDPRYMEKNEYGTFLVDETQKRIPLASPYWEWGKLYETVARSILSGSWTQKKKEPEAINYWWGMDSGAIEVKITELVPKGVRTLADTMMRQLRDKSLDIFLQPILAQDGTVISDGTQKLSAMELLKMDKLAASVEGHIPEYEELLPLSKALVRELGVHRDLILPGKEESE